MHISYTCASKITVICCFISIHMFNYNFNFTQVAQLKTYAQLIFLKNKFELSNGTIDKLIINKFNIYTFQFFFSPHNFVHLNYVKFADQNPDE